MPVRGIGGDIIGAAGTRASAAFLVPARRWAHPALMSALFALLLYLPTLRYGFVWDDRWLIETNPALRGGAGLGRLLLSDLWTPAGLSTGFWRPVVVLSYWIDGHLSHWNPSWFHAVNLAAHAAVSAVVATLALEWGAPALAALAGGLWFAAMPLHVESVAWISGRTDVFCAAFFLVALLLDRRARRAGRAWPGPLPLALLALALLCKETAAVFLLVVAVAEWVEPARGGRPPRASLAWIAPYALLTAGWAAAHLAIAATHAPPPGIDPALGARMRWSALTMLPHYLAFLWPWAAHTPAVTLPIAASPFDSEVIVACVTALACATIFGILLRRRAPAALPLALLGLALAPVAAVAALASFVLYAERHFYLASAGAAWALALALAAGARAPRWTRLGAALAAALVAGSALATVRLLPNWRSDSTLFASMAASGQPNAEAHIALALGLAGQGREAEALGELATAQRIDPRRPGIFVTRGLMFYERGHWAEAVGSIDSAFALGARGIQERTIRALALARLGRVDEARAALDGLRAASPGSPFVESAWGQFLLLQDRPDQALPFLEHAQRYLPGDAQLEFSLGVASAVMKDMPQAIAAFERAVAASPAHYQAWMMLAVACHEVGDAAGRDRALARASALPQARDGKAEALRRRLSGGAP